MRRKAAQKATRGPKAGAQLAMMNFHELSEIAKSAKRVDCLRAHGSHTEKSATRGP